MGAWRALGLAGKVAAVALVLAILFAAVVWIRSWDPFGSKQRLEQRAATAEQQVQNDQATTKALDHYTHDVTIIREKSDAAVAAVQQAPGADTPIPGDVLDAWRRGLQRDGPSGNTDDPAKP